MNTNQWSLFTYFSGETTLINLNLNKVTEDIWGAGISPTKSLAFCFVALSLAAMTELPRLL